MSGSAWRFILAAMSASESVNRTDTVRAVAAAMRPTFIFVVAYALITTPHEVFHALCAYALGFNSTIFKMWVDPDQASATSVQLATIAAAGPFFSLIIGVTCLSIYAKKLRTRSQGLMLLMLTFVGVLSFFGPLAAAPFGGDFHTALTFLETSSWILDSLSVLGWLCIIVLTFLMGHELVGWVPRQLGRTGSVLCAAVAPALIGTLLILAIYWPLPKFVVGSTIAGALFWCPVALGTTWGFKRLRPERVLTGFTWGDSIAAISAIIMIRLFAGGIRLAH